MNENVSVALQMLVVGLSGVFLILIFYAIVITLIRDAKSWFGKKEQKPAAAPVASAAKSSAPKEDPRDLVAVLSAAATVAIGKRVTVTKISFLAPHDETGWARLGAMSNHNIIMKGTMK